MTNFPQGYATFDGIMSVLACSYTRNHGITPSVATIDFVPQDSPPEPIGTLIFWYGGTPVVQFPGFKLDAINLEHTDSGIIARAQCFDRRWAWKFGQISGVYNLLEGDSVLKWEMTPRDLADLCLTAMGETSYDMSAMPNDARPYINWDGVNPAQALAELAEQLGCRVILRCDDTVSVEPVGVGDTLPDTLYVQAGTLGFDPPEAPQAYGILAAPIMTQMDFHLYAVGEDTDGQIKPIDDLSYAPADGWLGYSDIGGWNNITDLKVKALAEKCIYKWYAIDPNNSLNFKIPDMGEDDDPEDEDDEDEGDDTDVEESQLSQFLPLLATRAETIVETFSGVSTTRYKDPLVYGVFYDEKIGNNNNWDQGTETFTALAPITDETSATSLPYICRQSYSIDAEHGIVMFSEPVYQIDFSNDADDDNEDDDDDDESPDDDDEETVKGMQFTSSRLVLRIAVNVRDPNTNQFLRHTLEQDSGVEFDTMPRFDIHDEIQRCIVPSYGTDWTITSTTDNKAAIDAECQYYINAMNQEYILQNPETVQYAVLLYIELDGAIQQVTWNVGPNGATTRANYNNDYHPASISFKQRRLYEKMAALAKNKTASKNAPFGGGVRGMGFS